MKLRKRWKIISKQLKKGNEAVNDKTDDGNTHTDINYDFKYKGMIYLNDDASIEYKSNSDDINQGKLPSTIHREMMETSYFYVAEESNLYGNTFIINLRIGYYENVVINDKLAEIDNKSPLTHTHKTSDIYDTFNKIYPVISIYTSMNSTNQETLFGGTWEKITDRFLYCADSSNKKVEVRQIVLINCLLIHIVNVHMDDITLLMMVLHQVILHGIR